MALPDGSKDHLIARDLQAKYPGITAKEVMEQRRAAVRTVRERMVKSGYAEFATMTDDEVYDLMQEAME